MAENPLKYSDLLQPDNSIENAISQLKELNQTYSDTLQKVKSEAIKLQAGIEGVSGATEEQREKIKQTTKQVDVLAEAEKKLQYALSDTAKELAVLQEQQREQANLNKIMARLNNSMEGSYDHLSAQYSLNKMQLNKLSQEYRENTETGKKLVKETEEIYARMKQLQEATGKYTLNVGNYKSAWDGLGVSASQLVRELPSLAVSANTFFLAISNNIPMLVDEINKLKAANKVAAAEGQATVPVWKSVTKAFLSYNTAISLGITLLTVYGGDLVDWVSNLFKTEKALNAVKEAMQGVNDAELKGMQDAQKSVVRLNLLYGATQDVTKSISDRKKAVAELKKEFPTYFKQLSDEKILAGEAATEYNKLAKSILATAMARAAEEQLITNSKEILKLEAEITQAYQKQAEAERNLTAARVKEKEVVATADFDRKTSNQSINAAVAAVDKYTEQVEEYGNQAAEARAKIYALNKANKELAGKINIEDLTATSVQETQKTKEPKQPKDRTQQITGKNINITKALYQSETALITDELQKQRQALIDAYNTEISDLENKYKNDKDLTEQSRENINQIIINKKKKLQNDLDALDVEYQQRDLQKEQQTIELRLSAVRAGTEEENALKIQMLENARKQELLANRKLIESQQQDEADINAKYDREILQQDSEFQQERALLLFDQQQALNQSEFDLLKTTEEEKTRFKLQAEKERLQKLLSLNETSAEKMSDTEVKILQNTIKKIDQEIERSKKGDKKDIYDLVGLKLDDEQKQAISDSVGFSIQQLQSILDAQVQIKEQALQNAQEETEAAQSRLEQEIEARNNGYANDVATAQKEVELAKQREEKALKEKQKTQKQQQALDTLTQTSSLITASAEIWKALAGIPIVGVALALAGIATMWTSFAAAKIKAKEATKTEYGEGGMEFLDGGSHQSGNDIDLGTTPDGRKRRAEGGEAFAVINKVSTRKYRKALPGIIKSINNGTFEKKYLNAFETDGISININGASFDSRKLEKDVSEIKEQGKRKFMVDGKGRVIEIYKNLTRVID